MYRNEHITVDHTNTRAFSFYGRVTHRESPCGDLFPPKNICCNLFVRIFHLPHWVSNRKCIGMNTPLWTTQTRVYSVSTAESYTGRASGVICFLQKNICCNLSIFFHFDLKFVYTIFGKVFGWSENGLRCIKKKLN